MGVTETDRTSDASFAPPGLGSSNAESHGLRHGLNSVASPGLGAELSVGGRADVPSFRERLFWAIFLSIFGMGLYVGTNRIVEWRSHSVPIRSIYFSWERSIPFVPLMVIPYWSMDLLYFFGPLVCRSRGLLKAHAKRMIVSFVICCAIFLVFPLREAFDRPAVPGISGWFFAQLSVVDRPFNMAPSLHIVELVLLWVVYIPATSGWVRRIVQCWFVLIYLSTLLTFQHHVIDLITGQILAMYCIYAFPSTPRSEMSSS